MNSAVIGGITRFFGNVRPKTLRAYKFARYGDTPNAPIIPRTQCKPTDLSAFIPPVSDQDGVGACNAFATCGSVETARAVEGLPYVALSPGFLYGSINGQVDEGSALEDGLKQMENVGTCPASLVDPLTWQHSKWPPIAGLNAQSAKYRILAALLCPSGDTLIDAMVSALSTGFVLVTGALWRTGYDPDSSGIIPRSATNSGVAGGHAFMVYGWRPDPDGTVWFRMRNSWGPTWGDTGSAWIHESAYGTEIGGIYAVRSTVYPS